MKSLNKTFTPIKDQVNRKWYLIDCKNQKLGRLATIVTNLLKGKGKPEYCPSIDIGDYVILTNSDLIILNKTVKHYFVYKPGHPGRSLKIKTASDCISELIIKRAVKRMLSKTESKKLMRRLKIYKNIDHQNKSQNPIEITIK